MKLNLVPVLGSWHKGSNAISVSSPVMDEKWMRPCNSVGWVLHISLSALTLLVRWQVHRVVCFCRVIHYTA